MGDRNKENVDIFKRLDSLEILINILLEYMIETEIIDSKILYDKLDSYKSNHIESYFHYGNIGEA